MNDYNRKLTKEEIEEIGSQVVGKTLGELTNFNDDLDNLNNKGSIGEMIEQRVFGYSPNNNAEPDFFDAGIELKVTPIKKNKNGTYSAKERLVLNIINYMEEYKYNFENSNFWYKNEHLYLMFYLFEEDVPKEDYRIVKQMLYEYPEEDLLIIKQDWEYIINKIKNGLAHEISEADTLYLGACPKGKNKDSLREQPFSDIKAMQRAFCLKNSYMTNMVRKMISNEELENIICPDELSNISFEEALYEKVKNYIGKTKEDLSNYFGVNLNSKNYVERIFAKMLGIKGNINDTEEFIKANIVCKTIRVKANGKIKESMSFPAFKYKDIIKEEWETSELRNSFAEKKYLFVIFKEQNDTFLFDGIKLWNMPLYVLDKDVKYVWKKTVEVISTGNIVKSIGKIRHTNFPGLQENDVAHVRPHGRDSTDVFELPVQDKLTKSNVYTKHCFWLNNKYIEKIIEK